MHKLIGFGAAIVMTGQAQAQEVRVTPLAEARLRYEHVDQDGLAENADALTLRVRAGVSASAGGFGALVEAQGNLAVADAYYDGLEGPATRPLVADPQNVAIHRLQGRYASRRFALTAGRQRIALDDERFVGASGFRQNGQSFDAVRLEWTPLAGVKADASYVWSVRTIWGIDGTGPRQRAVGGDTVLLNASARTPLGTLTGFGYWIDQDEAAVQGYRLSSRTFGARLVGIQALAADVKLGWTASHARQSDHHRNPNRYRADYWLGELALDARGWKLAGGYEVLGADRGTALTSFQTPLATGFKFNGWADKFLTTPPDGLRDLYLSVGRGWKVAGPARPLSLQATWHRFTSDRLLRRYGDEIDLLATARLGRYTLSARYAAYQASGFATDTHKAWLQLEWAF
jgi:hypothetical protein